MDQLEYLEYKRRLITRQMQQSRQRMMEDYHHLVKPSAVPESPMSKALYFFERGKTLYHGLQMGYRIGAALSMVLGITKLFRKRK